MLIRYIPVFFYHGHIFQFVELSSAMLARCNSQHSSCRLTLLHPDLLHGVPVLVAGLSSHRHLRGQPVVPVGRSQVGHQAAAGEQRQRLDGVPHRAASLAHGNANAD